MVNESENSIAYTGDCSKALRAIGYCLEAVQVEAFVVMSEGRNYIVRVENQRLKKRKIKDGLKESGLQILQQIVPGHHLAKRPSVGLQLIYTPEDIERLQGEGQSRRRNGGQLDPHSLPQALRAMGAYIHGKGARFLQMSRHGPSMTIRYETAAGHITEEFTRPSLYDLVVRMYLKRSDRRKTN